MRERNYKFIDEQHKLDGVLNNLMQKDAWGTDVETTGLEPYVHDVQMLQVGRPEEGYIIDTRVVNIEPLRPFFDDRKIKKIGHNIKFDYRMMKSSKNIEIESPRCTYTAEKVIGNGRKFSGFSLADLSLEYLGIYMDKSVRKSFIGHTGPFTKSQIDYGEDDTCILLPIYQKQVEKMTREGLGKAYIIETEAIPAFADMELSGLILDKEAWLKTIAFNEGERDKLEARMRELVSPWIGNDLFGAPQINFASPQQVLNIMKMMRIRLPVLQPDGSEIMTNVTSTGDEVLKKLQHIEFCRSLSDWRSYSVLVNTFGQSYIDAISKVTGRIHPDYRVLGTETGRPASGDSLVNMLNIPKDNMFRHCFIGDIDEIVESDDYNGCESRILAYLSKDPILNEIFNKGQDVHCKVASFLFNQEITKAMDPNNYRAPAKKLNFGIAYGQGPQKFYEDLNAEGFKIDRDAAFKLYYKYCNLLHVAVNYIKNEGAFAIENGYAVNINGRRRYFRVPTLSECKGGDAELKRIHAKIRRDAGNFSIQSVNADIAKDAMAKIRFHIKDNKIRSQFVNFVYDEIVTRTHKDDHEEFHKAKLQIMRECAEKVIKTVPMLVDGHAGFAWHK